MIKWPGVKWKCGHRFVSDSSYLRGSNRLLKKEGGTSFNILISSLEYSRYVTPDDLARLEAAACL